MLLIRPPVALPAQKLTIGRALHRAHLLHCRTVDWPVDMRNSARRQSVALTRGPARARFEAGATLERFDYTANPKLPAAAIRDLAALRWLAAGESVILFGPVGVGKTHVAQGLGHAVVRRGIDVRFIKTSRLLADLAGGHADRTWDRRLREYTRPAVLILDDFALREHTAAQADDLYELISERAVPPGR